MMFIVYESILFLHPRNNSKSDSTYESDYEIADNKSIRNSHNIYFVFNNNMLSITNDIVMTVPIRNATRVTSAFPWGKKKLTTVDANNIFERSAK